MDNDALLAKAPEDLTPEEVFLLSASSTNEEIELFASQETAEMTLQQWQRENTTSGFYELDIPRSRKAIDAKKQAR